MTPVHFWDSAERDLGQLQAYLETNAPDAKQAVLDDIGQSLWTISTFPSAGAQVPDRHYRRIITGRYRFKIVYEVSAEQINVLAILRQQGRQL